jgi:beta-N-acetylhexosaminidase
VDVHTSVRFSVLALVALLAGSGCGTTSPNVAGTSPTPTAAATTPASCGEQLWSRLSPTQRVGQLIFLGLVNNQLGPAERNAIQLYGVGSVWFTELTNAPSSYVAGVSAQVQALAGPADGGIGLLVGANQEGGQIDQFHGPGFTPIPSALQQGSEDPGTLEVQAAAWAAQLKQAGVNLNLAPVMDTVPPGHDQSNAPIGALQREFGHDPGTVSVHGLAFIAGMHQAGELVTIKHFPGLGRVVGNTDFAASVVDQTTTPDDPYLEPFRRATAAGADLVMVSTATYTKIDPQHLAVFSPVVMGLLRNSLHFDGVIVADDLGSAVSVASIPPGDRAVDFIAAGGDLVTVKTANLVGPMVGAILQRAAADPAFAGQVDTATKKVLELKIHAGLAGCGGA